jgi:hypothetical protein
MTTTTTTRAPRQRKPRPKPARFVRLVIKPDGANSLGVVRLTVAGRSADYLLTPLATDYGKGYRLEKIGLEANGEAYHVNLGADGGTCECKGFLRWGHCKHTEGLAALIAAGRL